MPGCYEKAVSTLDIKETATPEDKIFEKLGGIVFHDFDKVDNLYSKIIGINLPDTNRLKAFRHKRHNISHRRGISGLDLMSATTPTKQEIKELIEIATDFGMSLSKQISILI